MVWSCIFFFIIKGSSVVIGMLLYANYHDCDPIATKVNVLFTHLYDRNIIVLQLSTMTGEGCFPSKLKYSEIKPLSIKGDEENPGNYRPVSILM